MATAFACFRPSPTLSATAASHRKTTTSSSCWWAPLFGWSSSDVDYITSIDKNKNNASVGKTSDLEAERSRSRFAPGCFTEEKARQLRRTTAETATFHDIMYHSAIATRLASDL
ncbi:uncharacterized protein LOC127790676 [Diospyros lotus]|uniref:uncharacterized protein LOC127790676 n=1 Tax=Diospyros lotus TaxID=55363 RepID=UPI00224E9E5A|nr:uncharacterized protein LOC127790676 [Diospyros lotus]